MNPNNASQEQPSDDLVDVAEQLIWSLLDETLEEADIRRLEALIRDNEEVRTRHLECVQLHSELTGLFSARPTVEGSGPNQSPVLGSLGDNRPKSDSWPPVAD